MDKKNFTIGGLLLVLAFAILFFGPRSAPPATTRTPGTEKTPTNAPAAPGVAPAALPSPTHSAPPPESAINAAFAAVSRDSADATITNLSNGVIEARFTDSGGALLEVGFIKRDEK